MITKDNFADLIQTIDPKELTEELEKEHDFILMRACIFNAGGFAIVKSTDYSEEVEMKANISGNLFCSKDDFFRLLKETQAKSNNPTIKKEMSG